MSSYIHFFVRKNDVFAPIATYGRSSKIYYAFDQLAPYGKIRALTASNLRVVDSEYLDRAEYFENQIREVRDRIQLIASFNNDLEDKLRAIEGEESFIAEIKADAEETAAAHMFIGFLRDIIAEVEYDSKYDPDNYLYVGIDCGDEDGEVDESFIEEDEI